MTGGGNDPASGTQTQAGHGAASIYKRADTQVCPYKGMTEGKEGDPPGSPYGGDGPSRDGQFTNCPYKREVGLSRFGTG